jgi:Na+/H+ antiporter NhaD/arsenite permease-like protein
LRDRARVLLDHPVVRTLLFERLLLTASATLAVAAIAMGRVEPREVPELLDLRLLALFFVLTIAVELLKDSDTFDLLVVWTVRKAKSARGLGVSLAAATAFVSALLTNDVALLIVVPFTLQFRSVEGLDLAPLVVLEIASANLLGCLTPIGNPQNLFLFHAGNFTPARFFAAQAPWVGAAALSIGALALLLLPRRPIAAPVMPRFDVHRGYAAAGLGLLTLEIAAIFDALPWWIPLAAAAGGAGLLGRRVFDADFSLVFVFAFLFVGVEGLQRGALYEALDPEQLFGHRPPGLVLSGALLSQAVSNVPAALLLAPTVATPEGFRALLYGVNAGGCGTPISSLANLIGAQIYLREPGSSARRFWRLFTAVSAALLTAMLLVSLALIR